MPMLTEIAPIASTLSALLTGEPRQHGALTVMPLMAPALDEPDWLTLGEAGTRVRIAEVSEAGAVAELRVANLADRPVLLLEGEELVGAKQNRVLDMSGLVAAGAEIAIPVSCVEQGRWRSRQRHFVAGGASLYASLRRQKAQWLGPSGKAGHAADQVAIWAALARKGSEHGVESPTGAMRDSYAKYGREIEAARQALAAVPGQVGALVYLSGRWVGLDLLAGPRLFASAWGRLCAGYAAAALGQEPSGRPIGAATGVLGSLAVCQARPLTTAGAGAAFRFAGPAIIGAALIAEGHLAHLMAFPGPMRADVSGS